MKFDGTIKNNPNFAHTSSGRFYHVKSGKYFGKIVNNINWFMGTKEGVDYCKQGALITFDYGLMCEYKFVKNNGDVLIHEHINGFKNDMIRHDLLEYDSGINLSKYYKDGTSEYDYYFYDGEKVHETDFDRLVDKVEKREYKKQMFADPDDYFFTTRLIKGHDNLPN